MTVREALRALQARLERAGVPDASVDAGLLLGYVMDMDHLMLRLESMRSVPQEALERLEALTLRREAREPLQYILGETGFMGLTFDVRPGVLIPRPDTEILCEEALRELKPGMRVLDIGTGSGALAVSIAAHCPGAQVTAVDISAQALEIARGNALKNGAQVRFLESDCFSAIEGERFDLIVSNPPYISEEEMTQLMPEVLKEPELALRGGQDGLDFYRRIAREAPAHLRSGGRLLFEIGWMQKDAVTALLREHIGEPFAFRDYGGNWRVCGAQMEKG